IRGRAETRSDIYGVGATMVHLLTGQEPAALDVPSLAEDHPEVDPELAQIVDRATAFDAEDRWESASAFKAALQGWLARRQGGSMVNAASVVAPPPPAAPSGVRSSGSRAGRSSSSSASKVKPASVVDDPA